jgi:hypothetical protein
MQGQCALGTCGQFAAGASQLGLLFCKQRGHAQLAAMVVCGMDFSAETIARIQATVDAEPDLSRRRLSRLVCAWLDWRKADGGWKEGSCRKALAQLNRAKVLMLPERPRICGAERRRTDGVKAAAVRATLEELGEVTVTPIGSRHSRESKIARALLEQHHPLGAGVPRGAQMRYLIGSPQAGPLGVLSFSSGAWALAKRDILFFWLLLPCTS